MTLLTITTREMAVIMISQVGFAVLGFVLCLLTGWGRKK